MIIPLSALQKDGKVNLELQKNFWGAWHANVTDKHEVQWLLNYAEE
ncbi:hypothetical protein [Gracilibacillus sp. YIM 98692]|nr:hypothetical protein [Gracilibacillus sp. YIM 98692]